MQKKRKEGMIMCQNLHGHLHINQMSEKEISISTACQDCFRLLLNNPKIIEKITQQNNQ